MNRRTATDVIAGSLDEVDKMAALVVPVIATKKARPRGRDFDFLVRSLLSIIVGIFELRHRLELLLRRAHHGTVRYPVVVGGRLP